LAQLVPLACTACTCSTYMYIGMKCRCIGATQRTCRRDALQGASGSPVGLALRLRSLRGLCSTVSLLPWLFLPTLGVPFQIWRQSVIGSRGPSEREHAPRPSRVQGLEPIRNPDPFQIPHTPLAQPAGAPLRTVSAERACHSTCTLDSLCSSSSTHLSPGVAIVRAERASVSPLPFFSTGNRLTGPGLAKDNGLAPKLDTERRRRRPPCLFSLFSRAADTSNRSNPVNRDTKSRACTACTAYATRRRSSPSHSPMFSTRSSPILRSIHMVQLL
jgi:hypothetical protein